MLYRFIIELPVRFLQLEMISNFNHKILHVLCQTQAFRAVDFFAHFAVVVILMPVPGNIGTALSEFFTGVLGNRAAEAHQHIKNSAGWTVQHAAVGSLAVDDALPFFYRGFHNADLIHKDLLSCRTPTPCIIESIARNFCAHAPDVGGRY